MPILPAFSDESPTPSPETPTSTTTGTPATASTATTPPTVTVALPAFSRRRRQATPDPLPEDATVDDAGDAPAEQTGPSGSASGAPRTTSSTGEPPAVSAAVMAGAVAALIGIAGAVAAAVLVRLPQPRELRRPTDDEADAIAAPLARIARRHVPAVALGPDLLDAVALAGAVTDYAGSAPLTYPLAPQTLPAPDDDTTQE